MCAAALFTPPTLLNVLFCATLLRYLRFTCPSVVLQIQLTKQVLPRNTHVQDVMFILPKQDQNIYVTFNGSISPQIAPFPIVVCHTITPKRGP